MSHTILDNKPSRWSDDRGASLVEYALLVALIATVCLLAIAFVGTSLNDSIDRSGQSIVSVGG